jgi:hypothetical protein
MRRVFVNKSCFCLCKEDWTDILIKLAYDTIHYRIAKSTKIRLYMLDLFFPLYLRVRTSPKVQWSMLLIDLHREQRSAYTYFSRYELITVKSLDYSNPMKASIVVYSSKIYMHNATAPLTFHSTLMFMHTVLRIHLVLKYCDVLWRNRVS